MMMMFYKGSLVSLAYFTLSKKKVYHCVDPFHNVVRRLEYQSDPVSGKNKNKQTKQASPAPCILLVRSGEEADSAVPRALFLSPRFHHS